MPAYLYMNIIFIGVNMKFKPLHDRVLIEVLDSSEKTAGGIIIPPAVFSLLSKTSISTLSCNGLNFILTPINMTFI